MRELARVGETRTWEPGATVATQGDPADRMHLIHEGELRSTAATGVVRDAFMVVSSS
jgi:CRP/FNR family cyclic AMP-dependent transcriptional regulator